MTRRLPALLLLALLAAIRPAAANEDESGGARAQLEQTRGEIENRNRRVRALEAERADAATALKRTRRALVDLVRQLREAREALSGQEARLTALEAEIAGKREALAARQAEIRRLAAALVRLARAPSDRLANAPDDLLETWRAGQLIARITPELNARSARLKDEIAALQDADREVRAVRQARLATTARLVAQQAELDELLDRRKRQVAELDRDRERERQAVAALTSQAGDLEELLAQIRKRQEEEAAQRKAEAARRAAEAERRAQEARQRAEAERRRAAAEQRRQAEEQARIARLEAEEDRRRAEAAEALRRQQAEARAAEARRQAEADRRAAARAANEARRTALAKAPPITHRKGRLPYPVAGDIVSRFGERNREGRLQQGISIRSVSGAAVTAPHTGKIVFAGPFRRYGLVLIIAHGEGYHSLLAGMSRLDAEVGQSVLAGEPVGQMGKGSGDKRELYVELRRQGRAIDPGPWLANRSGKVSG